MNTNADIQKALEPVLLYRVDAEKGDGKELAKEFKIRAYPTFIMVNKDGKIIDLWLGYDKTSFIKTIASASVDLSTIDEKKARYAQKPDLAAAIVLGRYSSAMGEYKEAVDYYRMAHILTSQAFDYTYEIFENTANGVGKNLFTYDDAVKAADAVLSPLNKDPREIVQTAEQMIEMAKSNNKPEDVAKYIQAGLDATATTDDLDLKRMHSELQVEYALSVKGDTASAVEYKKASMPKDWQEDVGGLNEFAWWCFQNNTNLDEAERLSEKAVTMAKPGKEKANNLDTLAEIKFARGKTKEAIALEGKAAKEDPSNKEFAKKVEDFQKKAEEKK